MLLLHVFINFDWRLARENVGMPLNSAVDSGLHFRIGSGHFVRLEGTRLRSHFEPQIHIRTLEISFGSNGLEPDVLLHHCFL